MVLKLERNENSLHQDARRRKRFSAYLVQRGAAREAGRGGQRHLQPPYGDRRRWMDTDFPTASGRERIRRRDSTLQLRWQPGGVIGQRDALRGCLPGGRRTG